MDVTYVVSHGFAARMVVQTDLLGTLGDRGLRVGLITPDAEDANLVAYCSERGVTLLEYPLTNDAWSEDYWVRRRYILEDIHANPALWEKHLRSRSWKINKSRHPWRLLRPHVYIQFNRLARRFPKFREWFMSRESRFLRSRRADCFLSEAADTRLLISTYPVNLAEAVLLNAANRRVDVKTAIHLLSWDNITSKGRFPALADRYLAWGPIMRDEFRSYYDISDNHIHVTGVPHFDEHVRTRRSSAGPQRELTELGLNGTLPYLFVAMSAPHFAPREIDIVEWLAQRIEADHFGPDLQLVVRPHPQNVSGNLADPTWLPRLKSLRSYRVGVDFPRLAQSKLRWSMQREDMRRLSTLLNHAAVTLNSGSTVSIDALVAGRPVILTSFDAGDTLPYRSSARRLIDFVHLRKLVDLGGVSVADSFASLTELIGRYLDDPNHLVEARKHTLEQQVGVADGRATERVAEAVVKWLHAS